MSKNNAYSQRPLFAKLGMKPGQRWCIINAPKNHHVILGPVREVAFTDQLDHLDGIHVFATSSSQVEEA